MLIYGGKVSEGPPNLLQTAAVRHRCQGTNWLGRVLLEVDLFEYIGTSKVRNLGCEVDGHIDFEHLGLSEILLIQVGLASEVLPCTSQVPYFAV